jgi:membrane protease YdiL (CAAX protease family)
VRRGALFFGALLTFAFLLSDAIVVAVLPSHLFGAGDVFSNGRVLALATILRAVLCSGLIVGYARRVTGERSAFPLHRVGWSSIFGYLAVVAVFELAAGGLDRIVGRPVVTEFVVEVYRTGEPLLLVATALVVVAPVFEELFFRGFLFSALAAGRLGRTGATLATTAVWTAVHAQYDVYELGQVAVLGGLFAWARLRSGSLLPPICMHAAVNAIALTSAALFA